MVVASIWRRAWRSKRQVSGAAIAGRGASSWLNAAACGGSTTSGTTFTTTTTAASDSTAGEAGRRGAAFHPLPAAAIYTAAAAAEEEELDVAKELQEDGPRKLEHLKGLVLEFRGDSRSATERWLLELDVAWVLQLHLAAAGNESAAVSRRLQFYAESWVLALHQISESVSRCCSDGSWRWRSQSQDQVQEEAGGRIQQPHADEFLQLVKATVSKMLPFVDAAIAAVRASHSQTRAVAPAAADNLQVLIQVRDALSMASWEHEIILLSEYTEDGTMRDLLSAELAKLDDAIWDTIDTGIRTTVLVSMDDDGHQRRRPCVSSTDVHKVTRSVVDFMKVLWGNYGSLNRILQDAALLHHAGECMPDENDHLSHLTNLIAEMVRPLEEMLARESRSFTDHSLMFLFLINNSYFVWQQLDTVCLSDVGFATRIEGYIQSYLQVSWAPVLKCLQDPTTTPLCFTFTRRSPLANFESKFQKTYTAQKLCKVPDPEMRGRLRKAIVSSVYSGYTKFLEDNGICAPRIGPQELSKMLEELFEG